MIGLAIAGIILWAIAAVFGKKAAAWVVLIVCTVLVFAIAMVIGRQPAVNQFGDPLTPPPLSSHQKPAATDEFGAVMWLAIGLGASVGLGCTLLVFILMGGLK